jgi:hypothetical protein
LHAYVEEERRKGEREIKERTERELKKDITR